VNIEKFHKNTLKVIKPSTKLFSIQNKNLYLETECLFGESFEIEKIENNYCYGKLLTDNYIGWVNFTDLGNLPEASHRVLSIRTIIHKKDDIKSAPISYLPLGSQIQVISENSEWFEICLNYNELNTGFVPKNHLTHISEKIDDWVNIAENLINTPYKWGGRDSLGIDCSALVQLSLQAGGFNIPRNSSQQKLFDQLKLIKSKDPKRGNLIFWEGHVGIIINEKEMIHSNAFNMMVSVDKTTEIIKKLSKPFDIYEIIN
jgi:hypothetical protein